MNLDFDKEMDILLRNALRQNSTLPETVVSEHLDADTLAAFAENALPQTARAQYITHLADCNACREILSNLILLNENEEPVAAVEPREIAASRLTWGERIAKLFALPNLGYATAALAVLLVGTFAFVSLYNQQQKNVATSAPPEFAPVEISERRPSAAPAPPERRDEENIVPQEEPTPDALANANTAATPKQHATPNLNADNLPPSVRATTGATSNRTAPAEPNIARNQSSNTAVAAANTNTAVTQPPASVPAPKPQIEEKAETSRRVAQSATDDRQREVEEINSDREVVASTAPSAGSDSRLSRPASRPAPAAARNRATIVRRSVGGKNFQKIGGVWTDSAYNSQNTINISRGSDAYKNLDASVHSIASNFGGETVIIVSQGKAYRIR